MRKIISLSFSCFLSALILITLPINSKTTQIIPQISAIFTPEEKATKKLTNLINNAKTTIHAALYLLTDKKIAQALIKANNKPNVQVNIILDPISTGRYGKADFLTENGVPIHIFEPQTKSFPSSSNDKRYSADPIMHNKFAIIDGTILWTGSFNWTYSANAKNYENVLIITNHKEICQKYEQYFSKILENRCRKHKPKDDKKELSPLHQSVTMALESAIDNNDLVQKLQNLTTTYAQ